ncbi:MAG: triose-phosphate isomerase [Nitrospinales bacterium]
MRRPLIAGNWKMNKLVPEAVDLVNDLKAKLNPPYPADVVLAPPFTALHAVRELLLDTEIKLAGQNIFSKPSGAYTGEISAPMLKDAGCDFVIIGHSERRQYFGEDDQLVNDKIKAAIECGLKVILCIGETLEQREGGETHDWVWSQFQNGTQGLSPENIKKLVVAYEPIWAIGTGKTATPDQAQEIHSFIREQIAQCYGKETSEAIRILYGGSVTPKNGRALLGQEDIDGALVGGASLIAESFYDIIHSAN